MLQFVRVGGQGGHAHARGGGAEGHPVLTGGLNRIGDC